MADESTSTGATDETDIGRISKVRYHDGTVTVERTKPNLKSDETVISGPWKDAPRPQFRNAFAALIPIALGMSEGLDKLKTWVSNAKVSQVTISKDKHGNRQISLVVIKPLEHGAITFNTPIRTERSDDSQKGAGLASPELIKAVDRVCREALIYVNGERQQADLFEGSKGEEGGEESKPGANRVAAAAGGAAPEVSTNGKHGPAPAGVKGGSRARTRTAPR